MDCVRPFELLSKYYPLSSRGHEIIVVHSVLVAGAAEEIARRHLKHHPEAEIDLQFLREATILHDIGIGQCDAKKIDCHGKAPYICHGVLGREILEREGLPRHALVCERHTGSGISQEEVRAQGLPLPERDYLPLSLEEKIICVADKFYGKTPVKLWRKRKLSRIDAKMASLGAGPRRRWIQLKTEFLDGNTE